jgi:transcriptional regulator with XRE-family HTH domain
MEHKLKCYLHFHRLRWGLTQRELAHLLGYKSGSVVSRLERELQRPTLPIVFGCQIIFGVPPLELFPGEFADVEDELMRRAFGQFERMQGTKGSTTKTKLDLLDSVLSRAADRNDPN